MEFSLTYKVVDSDCWLYSVIKWGTVDSGDNLAAMVSTGSGNGFSLGFSETAKVAREVSCLNNLWSWVSVKAEPKQMIIAFKKSIVLMKVFIFFYFESWKSWNVAAFIEKLRVERDNKKAVL